jgi:hypothetical protein
LSLIYTPVHRSSRSCCLGAQALEMAAGQSPVRIAAAPPAA